MTDQQYRVIADRDKGDDPTVDQITVGDRYTMQAEAGAVFTDQVIRIERPVLTTDEPDDGWDSDSGWPEPHDLPPLPTREQIAPLPEDARMQAYYYGFERTGVGFIDAILSAVAIAGKGSHHTESWGADPWEGTEDYFRGRPGLPDADNAVDLIQKAAQQAADAVLALLQKGADR